MEPRQNKRTQQTRERIRATAYRLFLQQGYQMTSIESILSEAGISSKETFYRYYASKEELFVAVLSHLTLEQPGFATKRSDLPVPHDLPSLSQTLTTLAREILSMMSQPQYLALVRVIIAETSRFPQLGMLFFSNVPLRGIALITGLLQAAKQQEIIADIELEPVARALLGGLVTYAISTSLMGEQAQPFSLDHADALVALIIRALKP